MMVGTLTNCATVVVGSIIGLGIRGAAAKARAGDLRELSQSALPADASPLPRIVLQGLGLATVVIGVKMALETKQLLIVILSIILGAVCGQLIGIEEALERLAARLKQLSASSESTFVTGFVTASVLFGVGPMTILGSVQDGLQHDPKLLLIKSLMDGVSSVILASTLGVGVIFSAFTVLITQGLLTLLASRLRFLIEPGYLTEFTAVGGLIIIAIAIRLLGIKDIKAGNFLPALVFVVLMVFAATRLHWIG